VNAVQSNRVPRVAASEQKDGDKPHTNSKFAHIAVTDLHRFHVLLTHMGLIFAGWGRTTKGFGYEISYLRFPRSSYSFRFFWGFCL
jgi:hypothetical protein